MDPRPRLKHQVEVFERTKDLESFALFWEQGCVSGDTEYLSPGGWVPIWNYAGGKVAQWHPDDRHIEFVDPLDFIVLPCEQMIRISGKYIPDQFLSFEHRVPIVKRRTEEIEVMPARELLELAPGCWRYIPGSFTYAGGTGIGWPESRLRLQVAVMADGYFRPTAKYIFMCYMRLKKQRKKDRIRQLLIADNHSFAEKEIEDGFTLFKFYMDEPIKRYDARFWNASRRELEIITEECIHWDGSIRKTDSGAFYSVHEGDVDFMQFAFGSCGFITRKVLTETVWMLTIRSPTLLSNNFTVRRQNVSVIKAPRGKKYCFEVPSNFLLFRRNGVIFPSGNTMKTRPMVDTAAHLYRTGCIKSMVVIADNGVHSNWAMDEIPTWMPDDVPYAVMEYHATRASTKQHQRMIAEVLSDSNKLRILCMSYDAAGLTGGGKLVLWKFLRLGALFIADESISIKSPSADRTKRLIKAAPYAKYRRILNGTPIDRAPEDVYSQIRFLDPEFWQRTLGLGNYPAFKAEFNVIVRTTRKDGHQFDQVVGHRNLDELTSALSTISSRVLKEDVLDLPPKVYEWRYFEMTPEQRRIYDQLKRQAMAEIGEEISCENCAGTGETEYLGETVECVACMGTGRTRPGLMTAPLPVVNLLRLQQCLCGYQTMDGEPTDDIPGRNPRLEALDGLIRQGSRPFIVFNRFTRDIDKIMKLMADHGLRAAAYDGRTSPEDRTKARQMFQGGELDGFIGNTAACAKGITLTMARWVAYYSNSFRLMHREQSEDRAHRGGLDHSVTYYDIACPGTVDVHIVKNLCGKKDIARIINGDRLREWLEV
jgi:hypothetical protein